VQALSGHGKAVLGVATPQLLQAPRGLRGAPTDQRGSEVAEPGRVIGIEEQVELRSAFGALVAGADQALEFRVGRHRERSPSRAPALVPHRRRSEPELGRPDRRDAEEREQLPRVADTACSRDAVPPRRQSSYRP